jgi:hypothetical protein
MALEDEHGGPPEKPEAAGRTAFYRGEHINPYVFRDPRHRQWQKGHDDTARREAAAKTPTGTA